MLAPRGARDFGAELAAIAKGYRAALASLGLALDTVVFRRVFLSDSANQLPQASAAWPMHPHPEEGPVALSIVEQPPLPGQRIALWAYHIRDPRGLSKRGAPDGLVLARGELRHVWLAGLVAPATDEQTPRFETTAILDDLARRLGDVGATLADHAVRTWFFVRDVDRNYRGMVRGRTEVFSRRGLTPDTHYLASTGIEGRGLEARATVCLDAYAIAGLRKPQMRHLSAPNHLGPTNLYGVTFERGTQVDFRDRRHVLISGTASIEPSGRSLFLGDVIRQAQRACDNVDALLADAQARPRDVVQMIVYLRDGADESHVQGMLRERYVGVPCVFVRAPVCRPEWLIEIECLAAREHVAEALPTF
jgi:enamine deaminase RidA (YjgF/YER057c/UK114 family)